MRLKIDLPQWDSDDVVIACRAAHVMANHFQAPVVILDDLSVKLMSQWYSGERVLEIIRPSTNAQEA